MKKKFKKYIIFTLTLAIFITGLTAKNTVKADSYVYDYWKNVIPSSEGITYKETYYNKDILNKENPNESLTKFDTLVAMEVYDGNIYLLDQNKTGQTQIELADTVGKNVTYAGVSYIVQMNSNFQFEKIVNEFVLSDYAKQKLDEYYHFSTPVNEITSAQYTATEFISEPVVEKIEPEMASEEITDEESGTTSNKYYVVLSNISYKGATGDTGLTVKVNGEVLDSASYSYDTSNSEIGPRLVLDGEYSLGDKVEVIYQTTLIGRAPYIPYSGDNTKAAVRLNNAEGITVTANGIYVADTENARILRINRETYVVEDVYLTPDDPTFYQMYNSGKEQADGTIVYETTKTTNGRVFKPQKVAVNISGTLYCIAKDTYEGLVEYNADTRFNRFLGKNKVTANALKKVWSKFLSETQISSIALDLPPMFTNITVAPNNFLYSTSRPDGEATTVTGLVKIINNKGNDIMKRTGYVTPDGDAVYLRANENNNVVLGPSIITAIAVSEMGNFTIVDQTRGRLFTYDSDGNLLYITGEQPGGISSQGSGLGLSSSIINPVALDYLYRTDENGNKEEIVMVLDQYSNSIITYETTEFGKAVNKATELYQNGVISDTVGEGDVIIPGAETYWRQVIKMNTNYELAYLGIGKALNARGEYKEAMKYFKLAHNATYYSKAYSSYRDDVLNENFNLIMFVLGTIIVGFITLNVVTKINDKNKKLIKKGEAENGSSNTNGTNTKE